MKVIKKSDNEVTKEEVHGGSVWISIWRRFRMNKFDSIIFDLDGTLWSTIESAEKCLAIVKSKHPDILQDLSSEDVKKAMGIPFKEGAKVYYGYLEEKKAMQYAQEAFMLNVENLKKHGGVLYPNVHDTMEQLSKNFKLCIVSNCLEGYIEAFLNNHDLTNYFCDYESHGRTGLSKGENIQLVMQRNGLKNPIYVGDTIGDKVSADFAGIPFGFASYGFGEVSEYDYKLDNIADLLEIVCDTEKGGDYSAER